MKSDKKILGAFLLNLFFSAFEFAGGIYTGSVAILSDAIHDLGDSIGIGVSYLFEALSKKKPDNTYTYGYLKFSVLGSIIMTAVLLISSVIVIVGAVKRLFNPVEIRSFEMIIIAFFGLLVNGFAAYFTKEGHSLNQKSVNLHMLEDVLGWAVVLVGGIIIKLTGFFIIDPLLSIVVAMFILINAAKHLKVIADVFLEKVPGGISPKELSKEIMDIDEVVDVHHIHIRSIDGHNHHATLHVVTDGKHSEIKKLVKDIFKNHGIFHTTVEMETTKEICPDTVCTPTLNQDDGHHHHHHHHHH